MNEALRQQSRVDYILTSSVNVVSSFVVMDPRINISDLCHLYELFVNDCLVTTPSCDKVKRSRYDDNMQSEAAIIGGRGDTSPQHFGWGTQR